MGDEEERQPQLRPQTLHQIDDLGLHRHVQRGDRFVRDDQTGPGRQRAGDPDALRLAPGELVRMPVEVFRPQAHQFEQFGGPVPGRPDRGPLHQQRFGDDPGDGLPGVQRGVRVLEDDLEATPGGPQLARGQTRDVAPLELDGPRRGFEQSHQHPAGGGLAAAGLADQPEGLARRQLQIDAVHRADRRCGTPQDAAAGERLGQTAYGQQGPRPGVPGRAGTRPAGRLRRTGARPAARHRASGRRHGSGAPGRVVRTP